MTTKKVAKEAPPPPELAVIDTPEHREQVGQALEFYAEHEQRLDPERAAAARKAAQQVRGDRPLPYTVGRFYSPRNGWVPNYRCSCGYANTSETLVSTHAAVCSDQKRPAVETLRRVEGIT